MAKKGNKKKAFEVLAGVLALAGVVFELLRLKKTAKKGKKGRK